MNMIHPIAIAQIMVDPNLAKLGEVGIVASALLVLAYALLRIVNSRANTESQDNVIVGKLIDQNERSLALFGKLEELTAKIGSENQASMSTFTQAFNLMVKSVGDYHELVKGTTTLVQDELEEQEKRLDTIATRVGDIAKIAVDVPEEHKRIEDNTVTILKLVEEIKANLPTRTKTQPMPPIEVLTETPKTVSS